MKIHSIQTRIDVQWFRPNGTGVIFVDAIRRMQMTKLICGGRYKTRAPGPGGWWEAGEEGGRGRTNRWNISEHLIDGIVAQRHRSGD